MVNITMLAATRPVLLKQALLSIGDLSNATVTIRDACMDRNVSKIATRWVSVTPNSERLAFPEKIGTGPARNQVIRESESIWGRGEYLYIGDDDVFWLRPDWLSILIRAYDVAEHFGFKIVAGYNHPFNGPIPGEPRIPSDDHEVYPVYAVSSQSMLMRWSTWDEFGPFCNTPAGKVCQSEDVDFSNRICEAGYKVGVISPALLVNTGITNSFGEHIPGWELVKSQAPDGVIVE